MLCNTLIVSTTYYTRPFLLLLLSLSLSIFRFLFSGARTTLSEKKRSPLRSEPSIACRLSRYHLSRPYTHTHTHTPVTYAHVPFCSHRLQPAHSGPLTTPCGSPSQQFRFLSERHNCPLTSRSRRHLSRPAWECILLLLFPYFVQIRMTEC